MAFGFSQALLADNGVVGVLISSCSCPTQTLQRVEAYKFLLEEFGITE